MRPRIADHSTRGVRRVLERIIIAREFTALHLRDLFADTKHRVHKPIQFGFVLRFRRFDHQRAGHRKADRRCVEAVVDQTLRDVFNFDTGARLERPRIENAFVRHRAVRSFVQHRVCMLEPLRDVVRIQDRNLGGVCESFSAHHADIQIADRQNARTAERRSAHCT